MELDERNPAARLSLLTQLLYAGSMLSVWCMGRNGKLYYTTSSNRKEYEAFLDLGGCKEHALSFTELNLPFVVSDTIGLVWFGEYTRLTEELKDTLVLIGPFFTSETSQRTIEEHLLALDISLPLRSAGRHMLIDLPVLTAAQLHQYIRMLHFAATGQILSPDRICYRTMQEENAERVDNTPEKHFLDYENAYNREKLLLQYVEDGNLHYGELLGASRLKATPDNYLTGDPVREAKTAVIIFISKCCDAAIRGGLSIKTARDMEIRAIRQVEKCRTLTDIAFIHEQTLEKYVLKVNDLKHNSSISQPVLACCEYIQAHFMENIELADIAKSAGYTEYYLSRLFHDEMGIRISGYLTDIRIQYAKIWLATTIKPIQEISELLHFSTRNYFSQVFKEREGITPRAFRERLKK